MKRNPTIAMPKFAREWFGGMDLMDMGAALGGLAAATMLPGMVIKTTPVTMTQKLTKAAVAFGSAILAGFVFRNVSPKAGQMAIAGGVAGALAQTLGLFSNVKIGQPSVIALPMGHSMARVGESRYNIPGGDTGVQVSVT